MQYTEKVMQHFMNPHNVGVIENPDGYGKVGNPSCGDIMEIFIKVDDDKIEHLVVHQLLQVLQFQLI